MEPTPQRSVDSLGTFPSVFAAALTSAPAALSMTSSPPRIRRWNSGAEGAPPRTVHASQVGAHPHVDPISKAEFLLDHTACRGTVGPTHVVAKLALRGRAEQPEALLTATRNSAHLLNNLRRRTVAEDMLRRHETEGMEWEKRFWLEQLLTAREAAAARAAGRSAAAHARTTGGSSPRAQLAAALGGSFSDSFTARVAPPSPGASRDGALAPGLANNVLNVAGGKLVPQRLSLLSEIGPREKGLSLSQAAARRYAPPLWQRVGADGSRHQPRAPDPPRHAATLAARDEGRAPGAVSVARPDLAKLL